MLRAKIPLKTIGMIRYELDTGFHFKVTVSKARMTAIWLSVKIIFKD